MSKHGGKRQGAGRKETLPPREKGVNVTFRLPRWMVDALPEDRAAFVRDAIKRSLDERDVQ